jgi:peptide/nickel transport system ATP-binding protein
MGLLPPTARYSFKTYTLEGASLVGLSDQRMEDIRGRQLAMIFQEPMTSLNPAYTIGEQLTEIYRRHIASTRAAARDRAVELLEKVGISGASGRLRQFPHQLSGGLRQRVMIAMALICNPKAIIADEPTTALDVTVQAQILDLLKGLQKEYGMGLILVTHDLGVVAKVAHKVAVMYAGQIVETGSASDIFRDPRHPYTRALIGCIPMPGKRRHGERLTTIPGTVPLLHGDLGGCHFRNRCDLAHPACAGKPIELHQFGGGRSARCVLVGGRNAEARAIA